MRKSYESERKKLETIIQKSRNDFFAEKINIKKMYGISISNYKKCDYASSDNTICTLVDLDDSTKIGEVEVATIMSISDLQYISRGARLYKKGQLTNEVNLMLKTPKKAKKTC